MLGKRAITEHKRQYQLQLDNNFKLLIDFKNNNLYCMQCLYDSAEHILMTYNNIYLKSIIQCI